jgi:hypothetical protein
MQSSVKEVAFGMGALSIRFFYYSPKLEEKNA